MPNAIAPAMIAVLRMNAVVACLVIAGGACAQPHAGAPAPNTTELTMRIHPVRSGGPEVTAVELETELRGNVTRAERPFTLSSPIVYASRGGIADRVENLVVRDASGPVPLTVRDDPPDRGGFPYYRHWSATRAVVPPVVVTYRMQSFTGTATPGPQFDFYSHSGGLSSGGMALFVLPESLGVARSRIRWDLSDLPRGSIVASTFGEGDIEFDGPVDDLIQAYYMAGPLGRYAATQASDGFHGYWLGQPAFDPRREMAWAYQSYQYLRRFFRDTSVSSYRVFIRALPGTGGGTALRNSFMVGTAPGSGDSTRVGPRSMVTHEMGHMFVGELSGSGLGGGAWFDEGLNTYYTRLLLLRSGLSPVSEYERDINATARGYYSNPFRNASADSLARIGFAAGVGAGSAQNVAYTRGSLYFADVDAKIRAASGGTRKLDDVLLPLFERRRRGEHVDQRALVAEFVRQLGPQARDEFDAVIVRGETLEPTSGAFGPCFERRSAKYSAAGREVDGFEWVRVQSIPEERCRQW